MSEILQEYGRQKHAIAGAMIGCAIRDARSRGLGVGLELRAPSGVVTDADISAITMADWSALAPQRQSVSFFDRMQPFMRRAELRRRVGIAASPLLAAIVAESHAIPATKLNLIGEPLDPKAAKAIIALTLEMALDPYSFSWLERELASVVGFATDVQFASDLISASTPVASVATADPDDIHQELGSLVASVAVTGSESLFLLLDQLTLNRLSVLSVGGQRAFPNLTPSGGEIAGIPTFGSGAIERDSNGGAVVLCDAGGLAYADAGVAITASTTADLELDDAPTQDSQAGTGTASVSLFMADCVAFRVTRTFADHVLDPGAVAVLDSCEWGLVA